MTCDKCALEYDVFAAFSRFEAIAGPDDVDDRPMIGKGAVAEGDARAGAFQQGASDKDTKAQTFMLALGFLIWSSRQIWFADTFQHVGNDAWTIVRDDDFNGVGVPPSVHLHR